MSKLIDELGRVHPTLIRLARKTGLEISDIISPEAMNEVLQAHWIQRGKFRYEIQGNPPDHEDLSLLTEIGCIDEVKAPTGAYSLYDGALLLGGLLERVRTRLHFLIEEYRRGVHFKTVYLLGSRRPLNPQKEGECLKSRITSEIEMMSFVVGQTKMPEAWEIVVVDTPDVPLQSAGSRSANTGDTFVEWQRLTNFVGGRFLVISNNPFVAYQETNARRILPRQMELFGIGPVANTALPLSTFLDNLAKQMYEENKLRQRFADE